MTQVTQTDLMPGVHLTAAHTNKFKTSMLSVTLLTPLEKATASANALLPWVLRRGTRRHPDMESLSAALDELYGGAIEPMVRKKGETQCVGFAASFLDDVFTPDGARVLEPAAALLGELLLHPAAREGAFRAEYLEGERTNLINRIRAQVNEKRSYSMQRLLQEMCAGEAFGVHKLGDEESAAAITSESLWARYRDLLSTARVELYYCGSAPRERVEEALKSAFRDLPRPERRVTLSCEVTAHAPQGAPRLVEERLDVTQGKLVLGFRTGGRTIRSEDYPALSVFNALYGGTPTSKLFLNVRERLSLCYFASSVLESHKGVMMVSSGIEFDKYEEAKAEILAQLDRCKRGEIESGELEGARRSVVSSLRATLDAQSRLEDYWLGRVLAGVSEGPEEQARRVEDVTMEQVVAAARDMELDTIYFLKGQEG